MNLSGLFEDQAYLLAGVFALSGVMKLLASAPEIARTGFAELKRRIAPASSEASTRAVWLAGACLELCLAGVLVARALPTGVGAVGVALTATSGAYLVWLIRSKRAASCGCFGTATPAGWKSLARAALLGLIFLGYATSESVGSAAPSMETIAILVGELLMLAALSDELRPWQRRARLAQARILNALGAASTDIDAVRNRLERQEFWAELMARLGESPAVRDAWRDGRWYIVEYASEWHGEHLVIVGSEYIGAHPPLMRIAVAREDSPQQLTMLGFWDSSRTTPSPERVRANQEDVPALA